MLSVHENTAMEETGRELFGFILEPQNWTSSSSLQSTHQRRMGALKISAEVNVTSSLEVFLRVGFQATGLNPMKAADYLEALVRGKIPFLPNSEWLVEIDDRKWIHFVRRYVGAPLLG